MRCSSSCRRGGPGRARRLPAGRVPRPSTGSIEAMVALVEAGVDIVEVGLPYSDPSWTARSSSTPPTSALGGGVRVGDVFTRHRARCARPARAPLGHDLLEPVLRYGVERVRRRPRRGRRRRAHHPRPHPRRGRRLDRRQPTRTASTGSSSSRRARPTSASPRSPQPCRGFVYAASHDGRHRRPRQRRRRRRGPRRAHPGRDRPAGLRRPRRLHAASRPPRWPPSPTASSSARRS